METKTDLLKTECVELTKYLDEEISNIHIKMYNKFSNNSRDFINGVISAHLFKGSIHKALDNNTPLDTMIELFADCINKHKFKD